MKGNTSFEIIGNKNKQKQDLIIYIPHGSIEKVFIKKVKETSKIDLKNVNDDLLYKYLYHEADTGVNEVINSMKKYFENSEFNIGILRVEIPRGFCDLNRPLEKAIPEVFRNNFWEDIYKEAEKEVKNLLKNTDFVFQFHSMNTFNPIEKSIFDENISENFIKNHIEKVYSGKKRECTILTETDYGKYITDKEFDIIFKEIFKENNIILEENTAYKLLDFYPCTDIIYNKKSSFFEITKGILATDETKNEIDSNKIIFDKEKVDFFAKVFYKIITKYLKNKKS